MPKTAQPQPEVEEIEEELLEDDDSDSDSATTVATIEEKESESKPTKVRLILSPENVYVFEVPKGEVPNEVQKLAKASLAKLKYTDRTNVSGFRVWNIVKDAEYDTDGNLIAGHTTACVLARNNDMSSRFYMEHKNYDINLAFKRKAKGRAKSRIEHATLRFGKLLERTIFKGGKEANGLNDKVNPGNQDDWTSLYAPGGTFSHYRDEKGNWKEANVEE